MRTCLTILLCSIILAACSGPKDTPLPRELDKMESIKPAMEKLTPEERELAAGYIMRHTLGAKLGALFGGKESPGIPEGMTLGKAIDEQRKFKADADIEEAKQKALRAKLQAEQEAVLKPMKEAVTVTLVSKKVKTGHVYDGLEMNFGYKNNSDKDIAGVKGEITAFDLFGDRICSVRISNDKTIKAGQAVTWVAMDYFGMGNSCRKLADLEDGKFKIGWQPQMIVFTDGTKLTVPDK